MSINNEGKINNIYIDITYEPSRNQKDKTKIFGEYFVKNNKDICKRDQIPLNDVNRVQIPAHFRYKSHRTI